MIFSCQKPDFYHVTSVSSGESARLVPASIVGTRNISTNLHDNLKLNNSIVFFQFLLAPESESGVKRFYKIGFKKLNPNGVSPSWGSPAFSLPLLVLPLIHGLTAGSASVGPPSPSLPPGDKMCSWTPPPSQKCSFGALLQTW